MTKKFENDVIKAISFVPGLVGLVKMEAGSSSSMLNPKDWHKGLIFDEINNELYIRVGVIVDMDIRAKIIAKEITSAIKQLAKGSKYKIKKVKVYIRGVR